MPDAVVVAIAKGVASHVDALLADEVTRRSYNDWEHPLEEEDVTPGLLYVDVVPVITDQQAVLVAQGKMKYFVSLDIAIRKKFGGADQDDSTGRIDISKIDELMLLTQDVHESFAAERLSDFTDAVWKETKIIVAPHSEHLRAMRQFTSIVRVSFEAYRNL